MAKKGATRSGGTAGRLREKNARMASMLPPAPATWRARPQDWPYHNNRGTQHGKHSFRSEDAPRRLGRSA